MAVSFADTRPGVEVPEIDKTETIENSVIESRHYDPRDFNFSFNPQTLSSIRNGFALNQMADLSAENIANELRSQGVDEYLITDAKQLIKHAALEKPGDQIYHKKNEQSPENSDNPDGAEIEQAQEIKHGIPVTHTQDNSHAEVIPLTSEHADTEKIAQPIPLFQLNPQQNLIDYDISVPAGNYLRTEEQRLNAQPLTL